jgi:hypothetical protein
MVRFGRGFPVPRQNFLVNPVASDTEVVVQLSPASNPESGGIHYLATALGTVTILTSEELVVDILGQGTGLGTGALETGIVAGGTVISTNLTGQRIASLSQGNITVTGDASDSPWVNPGGNVPRRRWKKKNPFKDYYYDVGVEFVTPLTDLDDYGPAFYIVAESDGQPEILRSEQDISSDYSIEGRP